METRLIRLYGSISRAICLDDNYPAVLEAVVGILLLSAAWFTAPKSWAVDKSKALHAVQ